MTAHKFLANRRIRYCTCVPVTLSIVPVFLANCRIDRVSHLCSWPTTGQTKYRSFIAPQLAAQHKWSVIITGYLWMNFWPHKSNQLDRNLEDEWEDASHWLAELVDADVWLVSGLCWRSLVEAAVGGQYWGPVLRARVEPQCWELVMVDSVGSLCWCKVGVHCSTVFRLCSWLLLVASVGGQCCW